MTGYNKTPPDDPDYNPFAAGNAKYEAEQTSPAARIYCDHAASLIPATALHAEGREALASMTDTVVDVKHLIRSQVIISSLVPCVRDADTWAAERGNPSPAATITKHSTIKVATRAQLDLALTHGIAPFSQYSLSTIMATDLPWAAAVAAHIRDIATTHKASKEKAYKMRAWKLVAEHGADPADLRVMPTATVASDAATVRIIEQWEFEDWKAARKPNLLAGTFTLTRASTVAREHVDWLWTVPVNTGAGAGCYDISPPMDMIPLHGLTLIAGREQAAKSMLSRWQAAQITRGQLPGHYFGRPRDVVIMATEESETKIRLKLEAAGADLDRVYFPDKRTADGVTLTFSIRDDLDRLAGLLAGIECGAVFFDPLKDFLGEGVNTDREDEVRPVLTPLLELSRQHNAAMIGLHHLNKSIKGDFNTRLTGSGAFKNVARSVLGVEHDRLSDTRVLQLMKTNDGELVNSALAARVEGAGVTVDGRTERVGRWVMDGVAMITIDAALAARERGGRPPSGIERAKDTLRTLLGDGEPKPSAETKTWVARRLNVSAETVGRAFREIGGISDRTHETPSGTLWRLPAGGADDL